MIIKVYYIENTNTLEDTLDALATIIPCFVDLEPIEMNYEKVTIMARVEDLPTVENYLAPLV